LKVLNTLPANQQEVLRLKFQGDLSYLEISQITNLSVSNVGFLIHTGLKTIRERVRNQPALRRVK
jgi:RNA polymerase sigma factor (sigma-70 family)